MYDLRSKRPTLTKAHQNLLPIVDLKWHSSSKETSSNLILSSDARVLKAWDSRDGKVFTNVEPSSPLNHVAVAPSSDERDSGLILMAGEQSRVMAYYVPALGRAPRWCAFLDSLTEELEEKGQSHFEDYRFVSRTELEELGGEAFVGTQQLRAHAHGFFMDARLYGSRRPAVLRCLHAIDATRFRQTRSWVVSFSILRPFGPSRDRDAPRRTSASSTPTASRPSRTASS